MTTPRNLNEFTLLITFPSIEGEATFAVFVLEKTMKFDLSTLSDNLLEQIQQFNLHNSEFMIRIHSSTSLPLQNTLVSSAKIMGNSSEQHGRSLI
jgi:hypothetical protein